MRTITIDGVNYTYGEGKIQAIHYRSSVCYEGAVADISFTGTVINSVNIYEILEAGFVADDAAVQLEIFRDAAKITMDLRYETRFVKDAVHIVLPMKKAGDVESLNHRISYVNYRLNEHEALMNEVRELRDRIANMEYQIRYLVKLAPLVPFGNYANTKPSIESICLLYILGVGIKVRDRCGLVFHLVDGDATRNQQFKEFSDNYMGFERYEYITSIVCNGAALVTDLNFAHTYSRLETVELENCPNLTDISALVNTPVKTITMKGCPKVSHLDLLEGCANLELLRVSNLANTRVLSENVHFRIEYI